MGTKTQMRDISVVGDIALTGNILTDDIVVVTIGGTNATGGSTAASLTLQAYQSDGVTPLTSAVQLFVAGSTLRYAPYNPSSTLTFTSATTGTVKHGGAGYAVIETDAAGAFACTATNSADQTLYFMEVAPYSVAAADVAKSVLVKACNEKSLSWAA